MADVFIEDAEEVTRSNEYAPVVAQLGAEDEKRRAAAEEAKESYPSATRKAPQARLTFADEKAAKLALSKIQQAAIDAERSARKIGDIELTSAEGEEPEVWTLRVQLRPRRTRRSSEEVAAEKAAAEAAKAAQPVAKEKVAA